MVFEKISHGLEGGGLQIEEYFSKTIDILSLNSVGKQHYF